MVDKSTQETNLIDGEALLDSFRIKNSHNFPFYIKSIWKDLSRRSDNPEKGFCKIIFSNYYDLPGIISTRLFNHMDKDKDGYLNYSEFSKGMNALFCSNLDILLSFIFDLLDENNDGEIVAEDVRTLFQYIPLQGKTFSENSFKDRIDSQEELHQIISKFFKVKDSMSYKEFKKLTQTENSTIFLYLAVFLLTKKPFNEKTLSFYQNEEKSPNPGKKIEDKRPALIASPNLTSKFSPSLKILHSPIMKPQKDQLKKELLTKYCDNKSYNANRPDDKLYSTKSTDFAHLNQNKENLFMNMINKSDGDGINVNLLNPSRQNKHINDNEKQDNEVFNEEPEIDLELLNSVVSNPEEEISFEGYLIKLVEDKLKKLWFTLYDKYLYYYKHKTDTVHKGMHCLTDAYVKSCGKVNLMNNQLFRFEIYFQNKVREYYCQNEEEYNNWIKKINEATGNSSITNKYDIIDKMNSGKFGLIRQVVNKETKEVCCLKMMNKKTMNNKDLQELKTEVEIMKICQHPNIVRLYDVFEDQENKYLIMELCQEGDLFKHLESKDFKLQEKDVINIIKQLLGAIYYLQQYGITHRDLKPENILVKKINGNYLFKIADFGLSKIILPDEKCEEPYGTLCYCAPEIVAHKPYNKQVDMWSLGIITYLMLIGCLPFNVNSKEADIINQILNEPTPYPISQWKKVSFTAKSFVMGLLQKDPSKRLNVKQALEHEWLNLGRSKTMENSELKRNKSSFAEYCDVNKILN